MHGRHRDSLTPRTYLALWFATIGGSFGERMATNRTFSIFMLGDETKGNLQAARREAMPVAQREALEAAEKKQAEELAMRQAEQLRTRATAKRREYFRQARDFVVNWAKQPETIRHSTLGETDDQYTACRLLGNDVWEARGVADTGAKGGAGRANWRVLFWVKDDDNTQAGFWEFGKRSDGELDGTLRRAGLDIEGKKKAP